MKSIRPHKIRPMLSRFTSMNLNLGHYFVLFEFIRVHIALEPNEQNFGVERCGASNCVWASKVVRGKFKASMIKNPEAGPQELPTFEMSLIARYMRSGPFTHLRHMASRCLNQVT